MARTSKSRGKTNFKLDNSPYPLFNPVNALTGGLFNRLRNKIKGGNDEGGSVEERLGRIEEGIANLQSGGTGGAEGTGSISGANAIQGGNKDIDPAELAANKAKKALEKSKGETSITDDEGNLTSLGGMATKIMG